MIAQVTTGFTAVGDLLIPGQACKLLSIQNNGTGSWRLSFDGGSGRSTNGKPGTDPTQSIGYLLNPGMQLPFTFAQFPSIGPRTIRAVFVAASGTQLLDICTDDNDSTAPAHA